MIERVSVILGSEMLANNVCFTMGLAWPTSVWRHSPRKKNQRGSEKEDVSHSPVEIWLGKGGMAL